MIPYLWDTGQMGCSSTSAALAVEGLSNSLGAKRTRTFRSLTFDSCRLLVARLSTPYIPAGCSCRTRCLPRRWHTCPRNLAQAPLPRIKLQDAGFEKQGVGQRPSVRRTFGTRQGKLKLDHGSPIQVWFHRFSLCRARLDGALLSTGPAADARA